VGPVCHLLARIDMACGLVLPVASSSRAEWFSSRSSILSSSLGRNSTRMQVLNYSFSFSLHTPIRLAFACSLQYSQHTHAPCLKTRNMKETDQCRSVSLGCGCLRVVLLAACCCAWALAAAAPLRPRATSLLLCRRLAPPCCLGCVFVLLLAIPTPAQVRSEFGQGLLC